jgi:hypothetical protein
MRKFVIASAAAALVVVGAAALWAAPAESDARKRIVDTAASFKGVPYVYGAESPAAFDCSGFVHYVYAHAADIELPRNSQGQYAAGSPVGIDAAKPGDILVFDTVGGAPSHVAIFVGDGTMIHAASEGPRTGVIVSSLKDSYFGPRFLGARCYIVSVVAPAPAAPAPAKVSAAAKTSASPAAAQPAIAPKAAIPRASPSSKAESPIAQIGFAVTSRPEVVNDRIPAATGTAIAFTITNATGKDGVFHIFFYKADVDFSKTIILREERAAIKAGASQGIPAYTFSEPGVYRLNVKTADNTQLMQRSWKVVAVKP